MSSADYFRLFTEVAGKNLRPRSSRSSVAPSENIPPSKPAAVNEAGPSTSQDAGAPTEPVSSGGLPNAEALDAQQVAVPIPEIITSDGDHDADLANSGDDEDGEIKPKETKEETWIPAVKRIVQFKDLRNNERVVPIEDFDRRPRPKPRPDGRSVGGLFHEYSVVLRKVLGADLRLRDYRLEVQSSGLREIFRKIGKPYKELDLDAPAIIIRYPFRCLFFLRHDLKNIALDDNTKEKTKEEITQLLNFVDNEPILREYIKEYIKEYETLVEGSPRKYREDRAWTLFRPHDLVYFKTAFVPNSRHSYDGCGYVEKVEILEKPADSLNITMWVGHHDGKNFGLARFGRTLSPEASDSIQEINIENLPIVPMRFLPEDQQSKIKAQLLKRGERYVEYCSAPFRMLDYRGPVVVGEEESTKMLSGFGETVHGFNWNWETSQRVVIDKTVQHEVCPITESRDGRIVMPSVRHLLGEEPDKKNPERDEAEGTDDEARRMAEIAARGTLTPAGSGTPSSDTSSLHSPSTNNVPLMDEDYIVCFGCAVAFLLRDKMWTYLLVEGLKEIKWREDPYNHLQMPEEKKSLVRNLVMGFSAEGSAKAKLASDNKVTAERDPDDDDDDDDDFDDFIAGKGKGLIFLLHGKPGLGKTLTAESVAESTRRPLYHVSTGELDIDVKRLEEQLTKIFRLGLRWGAVVLLDEADVLMTRRSSAELQRNSIVAVFLRMMEYYQGMLFLTTNRLPDFDPAFHNRIHINIQYGDLGPAERAKIWRQHLTKACKMNRKNASWSDEAYALLGTIETNGRDILNSTRTAVNYSRSLDEDLEIPHLIKVLRNNFGGKEIPGLEEIFERLQQLHQRSVESQEEADV